ncbi:PE-PPE domain-containing protein [Mycolicibacterium goodii]|uniref:PE-PPE domain-containing protein n=1 Tax=Mycolicibacterium goodii TaxID=134601 RepID=UPI001F047491|nr:PE-PPE domain-containing protein [Mycolicibacterium goodii]ULN46583.1 PE-PPE domain-containing protein [Mycolicibacterium goodii]
MTKPTPPRLQKAKAAAVTTAVVATTAALTAGAGSAAPEALLAHKRTVEAEVTLAAVPVLPDIPGVPDLSGIPKLGGAYAVGPVFWAAELLGIMPIDVIKAAAGLMGGSEVAGLVTDLLEVLEFLSPVDIGVQGPWPSDVYNAVNNLDYLTGGIVDLIGEPVKAIPIVGPLVWETIDGLVGAIIETAPVLNQRRAMVFSESLGGLTTSLAYRDMIKAVQTNAADWGEGVTGQWLIFFNNPSRPGGGLFALATPITNLFGLNLSTPPAGSYTNGAANGGEITKVLNTAILDISWAYNILSDAPTTLNPLAWANAAVGAVFLTYLLPSTKPQNNILSHVVPELALSTIDGLKTILDVTGGQSLEMVPGWSDVVKVVERLDLLGLGVDDVLKEIANATKFPGTAHYITYDSGNLPLLEPFRLVPRLLSLIPGVHIPTPLTDSVEEALRMMINMAYQDVDPETLQRQYNMAGEQAYFYKNPLTPTQRLAAQKLIFNTLIDGIVNNALTPSKWTPTIPGLNLAPVFENDITLAVTAVLREIVEGIRTAVNPIFDRAQTGLKPVTDALDAIEGQITDALDGVLKVDEPEPTENSILARTTESVDPAGIAPVERAQLRTLFVAKEAITPVPEVTSEVEEQTEEAAVVEETKGDTEVSPPAPEAEGVAPKDTSTTPATDDAQTGASNEGPSQTQTKDADQAKDAATETATAAQDAPTKPTKPQKPRGLKKITESFKATPGKHAADANDPEKKTVQETVEKVANETTDATANLEKAAKDIKSKAKTRASKKDKNTNDQSTPAAAESSESASDSKAAA